MSTCKFCNKSCKNAHSLHNHERLCASNPNRQVPVNQYIKAKKLGLPKPNMSDSARASISEKISVRNATQNYDTSIKRKNTINEKVKKGEWHTSLAKRMHLNYKGIDMHGSWEYQYAVWLDANQIKWQKCKESFEYQYQGKTRRYTPDFYLLDSDTYVEIKGYKTEKDDAKWKQFPTHRKLQILMREELIKLGIILN